MSQGQGCLRADNGVAIDSFLLGMGRRAILGGLGPLCRREMSSCKYTTGFSCHRVGGGKRKFHSFPAKDLGFATTSCLGGR